MGPLGIKGHSRTLPLAVKLVMTTKIVRNLFTKEGAVNKFFTVLYNFTSPFRQVIVEIEIGFPSGLYKNTLDARDLDP